MATPDRRTAGDDVRDAITAIAELDQQSTWLLIHIGRCASEDAGPADAHNALRVAKIVSALAEQAEVAAHNLVRRAEREVVETPHLRVADSA